jgi:hypothetical protein
MVNGKSDFIVGNELQAVVVSRTENSELIKSIAALEEGVDCSYCGLQLCQGSELILLDCICTGYPSWHPE